MTTTQSIVFTDSAFETIWSLMEEENNFNLKLRAYVTGGGCSGFQYGFAFDETIQPDDTVVTRTLANRTVQLLVDALSIQYLQGAKIDYEMESFVIHNPNAKTTCGCGSSFSIEEETAPLEDDNLF